MDKKSWVIKAVIVNIEFTTDFLLGLQDIRKIKLFRYIPELVEDVDTDEEDEETSVYEEGHVFTEQRIRSMGTSEWSEEERHQRARDAYDKEEIEEVDYNLVEAIPSEAFEEEKEIKLPEGIFGNEKLKRSTRRVLEKFIRVFSRKLRKEAAKVSKLKIKVDRKIWEVRKNQFGPRTSGVKRDAELERQVRQLLEAKCVKESMASFYSFAFLVPKPNGTWRMVLNFKGLNKATTNVDRWPIPYIEHLLRKIGQLRPKFFAVMDLTKGFYQCEIDGESSPFTAFITATGVYEWLRVPMGITAAPSHFQRIIANEVLYGLVGMICMVYIDDVIVFGDTEESYLRNLSTVLERFEKFGIIVNPEKCSFGLEEVEYVGHTLSASGMHFKSSKIDGVINFPKPTTKLGLKKFIGLINYFRNHVKDSSTLTAPLEELVKPYKAGDKIVWTQESSEAFEKVKEAVHACPKLWFIDETKPIYVHTDASNAGIGGYMFQVIDGDEKPVAFISKAYDKTMKKWCPYQKEGFGIFYSLKTVFLRFLI